MEFDFTKKLSKRRLQDFADILQDVSASIGFKVSARGWCYLMEQRGYVTKTQFDKIENAINRCRREGLLPVDFVAEEDARAFKGVEVPSTRSLESILAWMLRDVLGGHKYYTPDWWDGEEYYIQLLVEKIDLRTLFEPVCKEFHIPIANAKGWSSISQRAEYCRRFKEAEERGLKCVLLYCGDHDPDGLRISDTIRKNLEQVSMVTFEDGFDGYDPQNLIIERFGLNYDFIVANNYTWIDNLESQGGELARVVNGQIVAGLKSTNSRRPGEEHQNFNLPYLQNYLKNYGVRKCEANAIVTTPTAARDLIRKEIERWLGKGALRRFEAKREVVRKDYNIILEETGLETPIRNILERNSDDDDE